MWAAGVYLCSVWWLIWSWFLFCRQYKDYMEHVLEYLISFLERTQPLQDLEKIFAKVSSEFSHDLIWCRWIDLFFWFHSLMIWCNVRLTIFWSLLVVIWSRFVVLNFSILEIALSRLFEMNYILLISRTCGHGSLNVLFWLYGRTCEPNIDSPLQLETSYYFFLFVDSFQFIFYTRIAGSNQRKYNIGFLELIYSNVQVHFRWNFINKNKLWCRLRLILKRAGLTEWYQDGKTKALKTGPLCLSLW